METKSLTIMLVESGNSPKKSVRPLSRRSVSSNLADAPAAWFGAGTFILMHVACLAGFLTGTSVLALSLCGGCYLLQMAGITAGYHRYFSHRTYKTSRAFQFVLACLGCSAVQKGPLWWATQHRHHYRTSDRPEDLHSPVTHSLWWSHIGWVLSPDSQGTDAQVVRDLIRYPELRWLDRFYWVPPLVLAGLGLLVAGWAGLAWGFIVATVLSHHATFLVNSICHLWGRRRYATADASRNNLVVAMLTLGEGWHNNHHHYQSSANQGFRWWEVDIAYYLIRFLAVMGLVWDVRTAPRAKWLGGESPAANRSARLGAGNASNGSGWGKRPRAMISTASTLSSSTTPAKTARADVCFFPFPWLFLGTMIVRR